MDCFRNILLRKTSITWVLLITGLFLLISTIFAESAVKCFAFHLNLQPSFEFKFRTPHVIDKIVTISYPPTKGPSTDKLTLTAQLP